MNMLLISNHPARHSGREAKQVNLSLVSRLEGYTCHLCVEIYHGYISLLVFSVNLGIMFLLMQL